MNPSVVGAVIAGIFIIILRMRGGNKPVTLKKMIIAPLGMSTGLCMFFAPQLQVPWSWAAIAFFSGALIFSIPLIMTSHFEERDEKIYMKRSNAFIFVIIIILIIRLALRNVLDHMIAPEQSASLFFLLAYGMIIVWRVTMGIRLYKLTEAKKSNIVEEEASSLK